MSDHRVALGIGSNVDRERHVGLCLDALHAEFRITAVSSIYESSAVGFDGAPFYNLVVTMLTTATVGALAARMKGIEADNGRRRTASGFSDRTLDIDLLLYDDNVGVCAGIQLPRPEVLEQAYVLCPLAEILGGAVLPGTGVPISAHWLAFDRERQPLTRVDYRWKDRRLPIDWHHAPA